MYAGVPCWSVGRFGWMFGSQDKTGVPQPCTNCGETDRSMHTDGDRRCCSPQHGRLYPQSVELTQETSTICSEVTPSMPMQTMPTQLAPALATTQSVPTQPTLAPGTTRTPPALETAQSRKGISKVKRPCPHCGGTDHSMITSKLCPHNRLTLSKTPPVPGTTRCHERAFKDNLKALIHPDYFEKLSSAIARAVRNCSQIAIEASYLFGIHVQRCLEQNLPLPETFTTTDIYQFFTVVAHGVRNVPGNAMDVAVKTSSAASSPATVATATAAGTQRRRINIADVENTYALYYEPFRQFPPADPKGLSPCYKYLVEEYFVNFEVHVREHYRIYFFRYLVDYFREEKGLNASKAKAQAQKVMNCIRQQQRNSLQGDGKLFAIYDEYQANNKTTGSMLRWSAKRNAVHERKGYKTYKLVPEYSLDAKYITIDTVVLHTLLGGKEGTGMSDYTFLRQQKAQWQRYFRLPDYLWRREVDKKTFGYMIRTNGHVASVHTCIWRTPDQELNAAYEGGYQADVYRDRAIAWNDKHLQKLQALVAADDGNDDGDGCAWIGVDPGRKDVMTIVKGVKPDQHPSHKKYKTRKVKPGEEEEEALVNGDECVQHFSNQRYYTECGFVLRRRRTLKYLEQAQVRTWLQQAPTVKKGGLQQHQLALQYKLQPKFLDCLELRCQKKLLKLRWDCYIKKQRTVHKFCKEMLEGVDKEKAIVCYGDASFFHSTRGLPPSPKQNQFVQCLRRSFRVEVLLTNEYNTSQVCSKCMGSVKLVPLSSKLRNPHYVRSCTVKNCLTKWNRDVNGARNIIRVAKELILKGERPRVYRTQLPTPRLPKRSKRKRDARKSRKRDRVEQHTRVVPGPPVKVDDERSVKRRGVPIRIPVRIAIPR